MNTYIVIFCIALIISLIATPLAIKIAPVIGAMDVPKDARRMHSKPMPRLGGLAIFMGSMAAILIIFELNGKLIGILTGATIMFLMGIIDDIKPLSAKVKLVVQIICACALYQFSVRIEFLSNPFAEGSFIHLPAVLSLIVTVIWVVAITNTINLIDGLDGLAGGVAFIACLSIAYASAGIQGREDVGILMLALAGGALGFLPYNFHPAKVFMGDGGALYLGFMIAGISILGPAKSTTIIATIIPIIVLGLPLFDTTFAILRRKINGKPIMEADKGHLHHRIMDIGLGQKRTVLLLYSLSGLMGIAAILLTRDLYTECFALMIISAVLIYVFMTNTSKKEKK